MLTKKDKADINTVVSIGVDYLLVPADAAGEISTMPVGWQTPMAGCDAKSLPRLNVRKPFERD
ncbi:hypothetical protein ACLK1S_11585 [Escherichia coli]